MNDEEITMEWLQSIGFKGRFYHFDDNFFLYYGNHGGTYHVSLCCEPPTEEEQRCSHTLESRQFTTRAEVLRLISLLARNSG